MYILIMPGEIYKKLRKVTSYLEAKIAVGGAIPVEGLTLEMLKSHGLKTSHRFLDVGCGCFRIGESIIDYLDKNKYYGIDGRGDYIDAGLHHLDEVKLLKKEPETLVSWEFNFEDFEVDKFDYMLAQSVITHVPEEEVVKLFRKVEQHLDKKGKAFFSFLEGQRTDKESYFWSRDDLKKFLFNTNLIFNYVGSWNHPKGLNLFYLSK